MNGAPENRSEARGHARADRQASSSSKGNSRDHKEENSREGSSQENNRVHKEKNSQEKGDRGAATVWVLAIGLVLVAAGIAGAAVGAARVARHEARVAADFGALAGAMRVLESPEAACARAADLVARNGGRLAECTVDGLDVIVTAEVVVAPLPGVTRAARGAARAGPVRVMG